MIIRFSLYLTKLISFVRLKEYGCFDKSRFAYSIRELIASYGITNLREEKIIYVGENKSTTFNEVITKITRLFIGLFSTNGFIKVI